MDIYTNDQIPSPQPEQPETHPQRPEPHRGMLVLIFGIIGLFTCAIFSILAWIFGNEDLKKMESGRMDPAGRDTTNAGRILGIIGVALNVLGLLAGLVGAIFMFGLTMAGMKGLF
ncbi:MAG: DUF4190 domain-containing protein [Candidatus Cloacimonetes bacterium]|jgi:choline-glycine betaine transporter|nr:DUF4190 domain-containing protein [Candidatus Cloacimonadota bacterium]MDD3143725.1 DUF4190 domain-containing protein [Candidatus Cloacimonadota bacterium]MDY0366202.1 hypothetical protein [Candidatus Syntrophosphaera sp.]HOY83893.1 hypothetical protein [Candidatus Syntrophosphaera sp.]